MRDREVDIVAEGEVSGHKVVIGIERRASKRRLSIEWVERMHGKHLHLPVDKTVLVSSSGFTKGALKLADFLGIKAITPGEVTPGFVGEIVNNLDSVWMKRFGFTPEKMTIVFDPPIEYPDGDAVDRTDAVALDTPLYRADKTVIGAAGDLLQSTIRNANMNQPAFRDATGEETHFTIGEHDPQVEGESIYLMGGDDPDPP